MSDLRRDPILRRWVIIAPERAGDLVPRRADPVPSTTGRCPFEDADPYVILKRHLRDPITPPRDINPIASIWRQPVNRVDAGECSTGSAISRS